MPHQNSRLRHKVAAVVSRVGIIAAIVLSLWVVVVEALRLTDPDGAVFLTMAAGMKAGYLPYVDL